jgi:dCTP deaminase
MNPTQLPGILSDRQIRELCVPPNFVVTIQCREPWAMQIEGRFELRTEFSWLTEEQLEEKLKQYRLAFKPSKYLGIVSYRPVKPEEIESFKPMLSPFSPVQVRTKEVIIPWDQRSGVIQDNGIRHEKITSWGLSSYGYDVRCADEFKIFTNINSCLIDPKNFNDLSFIKHKGDYCIIPANSFILAHTVERFDLPRDIVANCVGKSTIARCGISVMVTPAEPEWEGYLTLEFANTTPLPAKLYANEGACQIQFFRGSEPCEVSYKDRSGKYMMQEAEAIPPRV